MGWLILIGIILVGLAWAVARGVQTCVGQLNRIALALEELKEKRGQEIDEGERSGECPECGAEFTKTADETESPGTIGRLTSIDGTLKQIAEKVSDIGHDGTLKQVAERVSAIGYDLSTLRGSVESMQASLRDVEQRLGSVADNTERVADNTDPPDWPGQLEPDLDDLPK